MRILLVDDDDLLRTVLRAIIGACSQDHEVLEASDGGVADALLADQPGSFDLLFVDLNMPNFDGLAFLRRASEHGFAGSLAILSGEKDGIIRSAKMMAEMLGIKSVFALRKPPTLASVSMVIKQSQAHQALVTEQVRAPERPIVALVPVYQPQIKIATGRITGFEALIRVRTDDGNLLGPERLFRQDLSTPEAIEISRSIIVRVMRDMAGWQRIGCTPKVSVNLGAEVLEHPDTVATLVDLARTQGVSAELLCIELTETTLPKDMTRLIESLTRLRMSGFGISLDDFGTGGSNFDVLRLCPFSELKLDRTIVQLAVRDEPALRFLQTAVSIAEKMEIDLVAEGIENATELGMVRTAGVAIAQGYLFSKAVAAEEVPGLCGGAIDRTWIAA